MVGNRNNEALASLIYNPEMPKKTLDIYKLMDKSNPALREQYREMILGQPTVNPYAGALYNPRACEIDQNTTLLNEIMSLLEERWIQIQTEGQPVYVEDPSNPGVPLQTFTPTSDALTRYQEWATYYPGVRDDLEYSVENLEEFKTHTDRHVANLPSNVGSAQNSMGLGTLLLGLANPCLGLDAIFGSIMKLGRELMAKLAAAIQEVMAVINEVLSQIRQAIQMVMAKIQEMIQMIQNEINALIDSLLSMIQSGLAWLLGWMPDDPCLKAMIGMVATAGAQQILKK